MSSLFDQARAAEVHLSLSDAEAVDLAAGKVAAKALYKTVKAWKEKAVESAPTARQVRLEKEKALESAPTAEKAASSEVTDMGRPVSFFLLCLLFFFR
jgi:hypothetical protein